MTKRIVFSSGVGKIEREDLPKVLAKRIGLPYIIFKWQDIVEDSSDKLLDRHTSYGSWLNRILKSFIYDFIYDETSYNINKKEIQYKISQELSNISEDEDIIIIAHSWGCVLFYDYLNEIGDPRVKQFFTFGCPLPLSKGEKYQELKGIEWINYWEANDPIAHQLFRKGIEDRRHISKNIFKRWNPLAHISYLTSRTLAKKVKKDITHEKK